MRKYGSSSSGFNEHERLYKRLFLRGFLLLVGLAVLMAGLPRALPLALPFLIALAVAMALNPVVEQVEQKFHISRRISALILTVVVVGALFLLLGRLVYAVVAQFISLALNIDSIWSHVAGSLNYLNEKLDWFIELLPANSESTMEALRDNIDMWLQSTSKELMDSALIMAANTPTRIGNVFLTITVSLLAVYFTIAEYPRLCSFARERMERDLFRLFQKLKKAVQSALGGYLRSQLLLALLAFLIMFAALAVYGQRYALLIALALGIVDFLPIVGTIAVLIPWAAIELLGGDARKAIFLLILAVGFFVLRRIVEPRIVGSQTGLHPLMALLSIYVGMKLSGVWGAVLGPVVVMIAMDIYKSGIFDDTIADLKELYQIGRSVLDRNDQTDGQAHQDRAD